MSIHINEVLDYLDAHPVCQQTDSMESLLEMLHDIYAMHNTFDSEAIRRKFHGLRHILNRIPEECRDGFYAQVCDLCLEHEQLAFAQGVCAGMMLMTEVNRLP